MVQNIVDAGQFNVEAIHLDKIGNGKILGMSSPYETKMRQYWDGFLFTIRDIKVDIRRRNVALPTIPSEQIVEPYPFKILLQCIPCAKTMIGKANKCKDVMLELDLIDLKNKFLTTEKLNRFYQVMIKRREYMFRIIVVDIDENNRFVDYLDDKQIEITLGFNYEIQNKVSYSGNPKYNKQIEEAIKANDSVWQKRIQSMIKSMSNGASSIANVASGVGRTTSAPIQQQQ
jgi:hypothetical protein